MGEIVAQASFNSGEWSSNLYARVDLQKYKSGAALLENFYIDYRGGASTRPGSKYILQAYKSATAVRLIPFQASFSVGYVLEFGDQYIRFYYQGSPIVETGVAITAASKANPCVLTIPGHAYSAGDWIYVAGVGGMTQLNGRYFNVQLVAGNNVTIGDLNGVNINSTSYTAYTSGGASQRVYTLVSPYAAADLALLKFAQSTNEMVICHPSYAPYLLAVITATNWSISKIAFGSTATAPTGISINTTLAAGNVNYSYGVTSIDSNGQESELSSLGYLDGKQDIRTVAGSNKISWTAATTAVAYNVYESSVSYFGVVPSGVSYGFIGTCKGTQFIDSNIGADFSQSPPVAQNPFVGNGISYITVNTAGTYTTVPGVSFSGGSPSIPATAIASLGAVLTPTVSSGGTGYAIGDTINFGNGLVLTVVTLGASNAVATWSAASAGSITSGSTPSNPISQVSTSGSGTGATATVTWGVTQVPVLTQGAGYSSVPTVVFSAGSASATATLTATSNGNPSVPSFFQQRLVLAAPSGAPQTFYMSQPGSYFNFNITDPVVASNAITETLVSGVLNTIKSIVSSTAGMLILTDKSTWLVNGGTSGSAVSPTAIVANVQSNVGASDVPPIVANYDVLFVQSKGSAVRDLTYNIYFNVFTGTDISITSSHLFFGYTINEWAWAESPFYVVWAVRSDGVMLTLTFLKEQEFVGWSHQVTNGLYKSVCAVTESTSDAGNVDAVYTCVQRTINGNTVKYIERIVDRAFPNGLSSAWCVDSGLQYSGAAQLNFSGAENLNGATVTGLATDDLGNVTIITPFVMPIGGFFTLPAPPSPATGYTTVTLGLAYTCKLQTLAIDTNKSMIQGKLKKIDPVVARVKDTLGLSVGPDFSHLVPMKDLIQGNVNSMLTGQQSQVVSGLYTGDARIYIGPTYTVPGQYCIEQANPYPATVLGLFPTLITEDDP